MSKLNCDYFLSQFFSVKEFVFVGFVLSVIFAISYVRTIKRSWVGDFGLVFLFSGILGNMCERLSLGCVKDYINFFGLFHFNAWDSAITVGITMILANIWGFKYGRKNKENI